MVPELPDSYWTTFHFDPMISSVTFHPIGQFHSDAKYPYDVPRQGVVAESSTGIIRLNPDSRFEEALSDLDGFDIIWVLFLFHRNHQWHPMVRPPRHVSRKVGLFATRSPYRPNPIGISAVRLLKREGLALWISHHDLLDGTPILDIKPYLPYADAFPEASAGWTAEEEGRECQVLFSPLAQEQLSWLENHGVPCIRPFLLTQLGYDPLNPNRHRLVRTESGERAIAYRTWRAVFQMTADDTATVTSIFSAYTSEELRSGDDPYADKQVHREFPWLDNP